MAEDAGPLTYASNILHFYDVVVRITQLLQVGKKAEAVKLLGVTDVGVPLPKTILYEGVNPFEVLG